MAQNPITKAPHRGTDPVAENFDVTSQDIRDFVASVDLAVADGTISAVLAEQRVSQVFATALGMEMNNADLAIKAIRSGSALSPGLNIRYGVKPPITIAQLTDAMAHMIHVAKEIAPDVMSMYSPGIGGSIAAVTVATASNAPGNTIETDEHNAENIKYKAYLEAMYLSKIDGDEFSFAVREAAEMVSDGLGLVMGLTVGG